MHNIKLLGIPFHYGQEKNGVQFAPKIFRYLGGVERLNQIASVNDLGDLRFSFNKSRSDNSWIKFEDAVNLANQMIALTIGHEDLETSFLLNVGGDHGLGLGSVAGMLGHNPETIVVWADAHGDINTPLTSPTGNFHGMPLSFLLSGDQDIFPWLKHKISPKKIILFGPRSLDEGEKKIIENLSIQYFSSEDINRWGGKALLIEALKIADPQNKCPIHLSLDVDLFDPQDIFSTGTREDKGPKLPEIFNMGKFLGSTGRLRSMDIVELNPEIGTEAQVRLTYEMTMKFIEYVLSHAFLSHKTTQKIREAFSAGELLLSLPLES